MTKRGSKSKQRPPQWAGRNGWMGGVAPPGRLQAPGWLHHAVEVPGDLTPTSSSAPVDSLSDLRTPDILPERPPRRWIPRLEGRRGLALTILAVMFVMAFGGAAFATLDYTNRYGGRILPGARIAGVDVGGMTEAEAIAAIRKGIKPQLDRPITLSWDDQTWEITPRRLGAHGNARAAVRAALTASTNTSFIKRMGMRVFGSDLGFERAVAISYPRKGVNGFIEGLASGFDQTPQDARIDYSTGWVEIVEEAQGREIQVGPSRKGLLEALRTGSSTAELAVRTREPKKSAKDFDKILLLRIGENKLYLYEKGKITNEWTVATGLPQYPTPEGEYEITLKRYLPTWVNPAPDRWGANMPASIPPGPGNPLGLRALNWDVPAIRFHGTSATGSLGYNASHGCVRLANGDIVHLYEMVEVGTTIVSVTVAPLKPLYSSAPDPIIVREDAGSDAPSTGADEADSKAKKGR